MSITAPALITRPRPKLIFRKPRIVVTDPQKTEELLTADLYGGLGKGPRLMAWLRSNLPAATYEMNIAQVGRILDDEQQARETLAPLRGWCDEEPNMGHGLAYGNGYPYGKVYKFPFVCLGEVPPWYGPDAKAGLGRGGTTDRRRPLVLFIWMAVFYGELTHFLVMRRVR